MFGSAAVSMDTHYVDDVQPAFTAPAVQVSKPKNLSKYGQSFLSTDGDWISSFCDPIQYTVRVPTQSDWLLKFVSQVQLLFDLPPNWDTYGAKQIEMRPIEDLLNLFVILDGLEDCFPSIVPMASGGLQAEWHEKGIDIEISIHPDGRFSFYADGVDEDEIELEGDMDLDIAVLIRSLSSGLERLTA